MGKDAMFPCIACGKVLANVFEDAENQPSGGTEFRTFGHYGSTFWDSFAGEEIVINVCDECLNKKPARIGRHKRCRTIVVEDARGALRATTTVGRQWVTREIVPYFRGPEDEDPITIEVHEIGLLNRESSRGYDRIEWVGNWREIKASLMRQLLVEDGQNAQCMHHRFVAECVDCGATPLEGLR
jgi:hypothetical protein